MIMPDRFTITKILYSVLPLIGVILFFRFMVWVRYMELDELKREIELSKRMYQIKEANYENAEANAARIERTMITYLDDIVFETLDIGFAARKHGLIETDFTTVRSLSTIAETELVQTRISCGFVGQYADLLVFLRSLDEKYVLDNIRLGSSGMEQGNVSAKLELSLYSILSPADERAIPERRNYFEDYDYENPFRYN